MADLFSLSDEQWAVIKPYMPKNQPGPEHRDDRQIISGILHVLTCGCRWRERSAAYGRRTTVYNRFNRWSRRGFWKAMLADLAKVGWTGKAAIDSTSVKAHRSAHGGKGGRGRKVSARRAGQTTKIHALTDVLGRPGFLLLTAGNASDVKTAPEVLAEALEGLLSHRNPLRQTRSQLRLSRRARRRHRVPMLIESRPWRSGCARQCSV